MSKRVSGVIAACLLIVAVGFAKGKAKNTLPPSFLRARTVAVIVDPDAGLSADDPRANEVAQKDVETALLNWGRFEPVIWTRGVDLIIVVRRGHGRLVDETIPDPRQNNRAGVIDPYDNGVAIGGQHGTPQRGSGPDGPGQAIPHPRMEIGGQEDYFSVYDGSGDKPLDMPAGWRYVAKDGLKSHGVPAVGEFRKALIEAEKAAAKKP